MGPTRIVLNLLNDNDCKRDSIGVTNQWGNGVLLEDFQGALVQGPLLHPLLIRVNAIAGLVTCPGGTG